ncbi:MAG TPA: RNA polymerase sigma factor [Thermoanaerobaculia bacterium]|nr:RNA polymerase sigma factor [Thermoanaerobaculia bacterium]
MDAALSIEETVERERGRLRNFIRKRVRDASDAEDILQDVLYELVIAPGPIERVTAWLFRVASNRIIDRFRKQKNETLSIDDLLPSPDAGPDGDYARSVLIGELESALDELPKEQRAVFIAHEIDGRSFKEISEATGVRVNTLLSRKHYAVLHLRRRLQEIYEEFR